MSVHAQYGTDKYGNSHVLNAETNTYTVLTHARPCMIQSKCDALLSLSGTLQETVHYNIENERKYDKNTTPD